MRRIYLGVVVTLLLSMLLVPQLARAEPSAYSISVVPISGVCNDSIEVRVSVEKAGTYYVCWDTPLQADEVARINAGAAGNFTAQFGVPEGKRGMYEIHLIEFDNNILASTEFRIYPTVVIDRIRGPVGTEVVITGYGFTAGETNIPVKFRGTEIGKAQADSDGGWQKPYTIPAAPGGSHLFEVGPDSQTAEVWRMTFTITPTITVSPTTGKVGETIRVSGTGFARNEKGIKVTADEVVWAKEISADDNGSWARDIVIPPHRGGTSVIDAWGLSTMARDVPDVEFVVGAGIVAEPGSAYVGDKVTVAGGGFAARETGVKITFADRAVDTGVINVDKDGRWEASFVLPVSPYGPNTVSASGAVTTRAVTTTVSTLARVEVSPAEGAPGESVTVTGNGFPGNQALTVTFANRAAPEDVRSLADGSLSAIVTVPASPAGGLLVTVTGGGAEASDGFTVKEKFLPAPQLISPAEGKSLRSKEITFEWGKVTANSDVTYNLQVAPTDAFTVVSWSQSGIEATSCLLPEEEALPRGEYYWRVMAVDEFDNQSPWSDPRPFKASPIPVWVWVVVGLVVLVVLMVVAYREDKFKISD